MSFYSVHGYYDDDFIMESGTFEEYNGAYDLCNLLNNSNNCKNITYVIVESKTLDNFPVYHEKIYSNLNSNNIEKPNENKSLNTHIYFNDDYDLVNHDIFDNYDMIDINGINFESIPRLPTPPPPSPPCEYSQTNNIKIKKYGVGYIFDCDKKNIKHFVDQHEDIKIYYLKHIKKYFFRESQMGKVLNSNNFEVSEEKMLFPKNLLRSNKLSIDVDKKRLKYSNDYKYKNDYYFLGGFKNSKNNCWSFKSKAFDKFLNDNTLCVQNNYI
jgi:hypothetical protein